MKAVAAGLLLAVAGCGQEPTAENRDNFPPVPAGNLIAPAPNTATAIPPPAQGMGQGEPQASPDTSHAPPERFIVCPGNPRCPPEGSQPKGREESGR